MAVLCAVVGAALVAGAAQGQGHGQGQGQTELQANRAAARRDAGQMLASLRLPAGVSRLARAPGFARSLAGAGSLNGRYVAGKAAWWSTTADPAGIITYLEQHRPAGSSRLGTGSGGDASTGTSSREALFTWPDTNRVYSRELTVTVVTPRSGASVIVARSQSHWMIPRSPTERVPSGVSRIVITLRIGAGPQGLRPPLHALSYTVWRPRRVAALVDEFDSLPIVQPGVMYSCPAMLLNRPTLNLRFAAADAALARAQVYVAPGKNRYAGWNMCDPISFWIAGRAQTALTSHTFVSLVGKLIGASIS